MRYFKKNTLLKISASFLTVVCFIGEAQSMNFYPAPEIQCTVVKVHKSVEAFKIKIFPKIYDSVSYDAKTRRLSISGKSIPNIKPQVIQKKVGYEETTIIIGKVKVLLKIYGFPISRQGKMFLNGELLAGITCH